MFALPLIYPDLSAAHTGGPERRGGLVVRRLLLPGLLAYGLIMSDVHRISVGLAMPRDLGVLKRVRVDAAPRCGRSSPGRIGSALVTATLLTVVSWPSAPRVRRATCGSPRCPAWC